MTRGKLLRINRIERLLAYAKKMGTFETGGAAKVINVTGRTMGNLLRGCEQVRRIRRGQWEWVG